jgi:cation:H+ antiporter
MTSLPDIAATAQPALSGLADQATGNALGGVLAQTAFLAVADLTYRRANLEHATPSLPNLVQASVLIMLLAAIGVAVAVPGLAWGRLHVVTIALPLLYAYGQRVVVKVSAEPLWTPVETAETRVDEPDPELTRRSVRRLAVATGAFGLLLAGAGWISAIAGEVIVEETFLSGGAVGALLTGTTTSLPELVVSVAAVRRGALTLAVATVIGGNTFDTLLMAVADAGYGAGPVYAEPSAEMPVLVAVNIAMTTLLVLGMLRRQRRGPGNIGTESVAVLALYALAVTVLL